MRQGLILNGDHVAQVANAHDPALLPARLGANFTCAPYCAPGCPPGAPGDDSPCVQISDDLHLYPALGDDDAFGGCGGAGSDVLEIAGTGQGNRSYDDHDLSGPKGTTRWQ